MDNKIASLMQAHVQSVDMDDTVADVERFLAREGRSWAPVREGGVTLIGVISVSDLLQFHAHERDGTTERAWQLCTYRPLVVEPDAPLAEVAAQMVARHVHHVVVCRDQQVLGVVSSLDFVARFARES